jgi:hypothetical protein
LKQLLAYITLAFAIASCKPQVSLSGATIPAEAKTISVGIFRNNSSLGSPALSQQFTEKLRDLVSRQTSLALIRKNADLQFDGYISDYNVSPTAITGAEEARKNRLTISVQVVYLNRFDPAKNFEQTFTRFADFNSTESLSSREAALVDEIFRQITEDIFSRAFNNW